MTQGVRPTEWEMPPKAKVYEAISAVADGRVRIVGPTRAEVVSSSGDRTYRVEWSDDMRRITSNDNASFWRGYAGYPIIAVLMKAGRILFDSEIAAKLGGVPWKRINAKFRGDYEKAVDSVLGSIEERGGDRDRIVREADNIYEQLSELHLERLLKRESPETKGEG
jgi:hypothetical protein